MFSLDPRGGHNRYKLKIDFFEKWSPEMAYEPIIIKKLSAIFTSGSHIFLEGLAKILESELLVSHDKIYNSCRSFQLRYSTADSIKIFELMYKNCFDNLYLKRKFDIFKEYFQMAPRKINLEIIETLNNLS